MAIKLEKVEQKEAPVANMPGGVATRNAFVVFETATTEQLTKAVSQIMTMEGALQWWLGDLGIALQERKRLQLQKEALELRSQAEGIDTEDKDAAAHKAKLIERAVKMENNGVIEYTSELAEALCVDVGYWKNCVSLAKFYEPSQRYDGLKPHHHLAAMRAAGGTKGDIKEANKWLKRAEEENLSVPDLRKIASQSLALSRPPETPPELEAFEEMNAADQWALQNKENKYSPEQASKLLVQWQDLISFLENLKNTASS